MKAKPIEKQIQTKTKKSSTLVLPDKTVSFDEVLKQIMKSPPMPKRK